jgi:glycosyltransferase involved in cell wall biosynthesis
MKVLFITNSPVPYRSLFYNRLGEVCDLTVLYERELLADREKTWQSSISNKTFKEIFLKGVKIGNEMSFCPSIVKFLKQNAYDIVVVGVYSSPTSMLAIMHMKHRGIPFILNSDGGLAKNDSPLKFKIKKYFIGSASGWLSPGEVTNEYLSHYGADLSKSYIYPFTSVEEKYIEKAAAAAEEKLRLREEFGIKEEKAVVSVGRFIPLKGFDILIKAAKKLSGDAGVYIVGGEPTEAYLKLGRELGIGNVHYVNFMDAEKLKGFYRACDLFVLPSRTEAWGLVINEAMANGLPVIATDKCVAALELIEDGRNGYLVPVDDDEALAERMNAILGDAILRRQMAEASLKKIQPYSIENMAREHYRIFEKYLNKRGKEHE